MKVSQCSQIWLSKFINIVKECETWFLPRRLPCTILCRNPIIIASYWEDFLKERDAIFLTLPKDSPSYVYFLLGWEYESPGKVEDLVFEKDKLFGMNPNLNPIFLTNSEKEETLFKKQGLNALFVQQNAFLNEKKYKIVSESPQFDAIYIARITPFKRHALARKINSLYLIGDYRESEKEYAISTLALLPEATWICKVPSFHIKNHIAKARVGLCLSQEEGAMFVSAECLLCGKPLVSTKSLGGRDALFDPAHVFIVDDNPDAVAKGVEKAVSKCFDPNKIRARTLELISEHRSRFIKDLQRIFNEAGVKLNAEDEWQSIFIHKLGLRCRVGIIPTLTRILRVNSRLKIKR
jgi:glycosyltransferase involved in cell wall biosynthesis